MHYIFFKVAKLYFYITNSYLGTSKKKKYFKKDLVFTQVFNVL